MSNKEIINKLNDLNNEDFIWLIYVGIIILSWYSNSLERKFFINNNKLAKEEYQKIMIFIFSILVVVYYYFFNDAYNDFISLKRSDSNKKKELVTLSFIASTLILLSGLILLYISYKNDDLSVEIAFN